MPRGAAKSAHYITAKIASAIMCFYAGFTAAVADEPPFPHLSAEERVDLSRTHELGRLFSNDELPSFAPTAEIADAVRADLRSLDSNIGVEIVRAAPPAGDDRSALELFNALLEVSSLEGALYYSHTRDTMRLLFEESYAIDSPESRIGIADPKMTDLPARGVFYLYQRDLTFGETVLAVEYSADRSGMHLVMENITAYSYGPIRIISPGGMRLHVFVLLRDDMLYYYSVFGAVSVRFLIFERTIFKSFSHRLEALYGWYMTQVNSPETEDQ